MDLLDIQVHCLDPIANQQESSPKNRREVLAAESEPPCLVHHGPRELLCPGDQFNPVRLGTLCWPSVALPRRPVESCQAGDALLAISCRITADPAGLGRSGQSRLEDTLGDFSNHAERRRHVCLSVKPDVAKVCL